MEKVDLEKMKFDCEYIEQWTNQLKRSYLREVANNMKILCDEVQTLRATLALHLGVAEDDPIVTKNKVLQELKTLRDLVEAQKELMSLHLNPKGYGLKAEIIENRIEELRSKIAELEKEIG